MPPQRQGHEPQYPNMADYRDGQCPLNDDLDGVCGCPDFWLQKHSRHQRQPRPQEQQLKPANTTSDNSGPTYQTRAPSGSSKETCFFWYHGTCRRGEKCTHAHECHITWPITPPPGYIHFKSCELPLCPLRDDLVAVKETEKKRQWNLQLGGQLDGAAMSLSSRSSPMDISSVEDESDDTDTDDEEQTQGTLALSEKHNGSALLVSETETDIGVKGGSEMQDDVKVTGTLADTISGQAKPPLSIVLHSPTGAENIDYIDMSHQAPSESSSTTNEQALSSLSHSGTLGKRKRPTERESSNKRGGETMQEVAPAKATGELPAGSINIFDALHNDGRSQQPPTNAPKGPRALHGKTPVCFYWYHQGYCRPRFRNGKPKKCLYSHALDASSTVVSLPPNIALHDPNCSLPLCPVRLGQGQTSTNIMEVKQEPRTPSKPPSSPSGTRYSPSPRDSIAEARHLLRGPKFNGDQRFQQLPRLTGEGRQRFKEQKQRVEQWQADNGIKPDAMWQEKLESRRSGRHEIKQKKREKRAAAAALEKENDNARLVHGNSLTLRSRDIGHLPSELETTYAAKVEASDPQGELHHGTLWSSEGYPEVPKAAEVTRLVHSEGDYSPSSDMATFVDRNTQHLRSVDQILKEVPEPMSAQEQTISTNTDYEQGKDFTILVDYELPSGGDRLDWDTDSIRQIFGEIE